MCGAQNDVGRSLAGLDKRFARGPARDGTKMMLGGAIAEWVGGWNATVLD